MRLMLLALFVMLVGAVNVVYWTPKTHHVTHAVTHNNEYYKIVSLYDNNRVIADFPDLSVNDTTIRRLCGDWLTYISGYPSGGNATYHLRNIYTGFEYTWSQHDGTIFDKFSNSGHYMVASNRIVDVCNGVVGPAVNVNNGPTGGGAYWYNDALYYLELRRNQQNTNTLMRGTIDGVEAAFLFPHDIRIAYRHDEHFFCARVGCNDPYIWQSEPDKLADWAGGYP